MSVFNLGVVFGPTLLRAVEETLAAILDIKFNNVVIEILIENYDLIFKNAPGKTTTDYLSHSSPPEPVPRTYGAYRSSRSSSIAAQQPVVRVVTRANYTDTVMSSSLQNIPNGLASAIYQNSGGGGGSNKNPSKGHPIYDSKPLMNQSTPSLNRDMNLSGRDHPIVGRIGGGEPTYVSSTTTANSHNSSPNHRAHPNHLTNREKILLSREANINRESNHSLLSSGMTRSSGDGIYLQTQRLNPMNYSESNLVHPTSSIVDRINSTSSSNESVCSASSLNHTYLRHGSTGAVVTSTAAAAVAATVAAQPQQQSLNFLDYNSFASLRDIEINSSQSNNMPKKTQRTKDIGRQRYNSPKDNV